MTDQDTPAVMHRGLVVVGAILIQLCLGAIYAWSVFTPPLTASQAGDIAAIYDAGRLGLSADEFDAMNAQLNAPRSELKEVSAKIKGTTDDTERKALTTRKSALVTGIDAVVHKYVSQETLDTLGYGLTQTQAQWIFSVGLASFAVIMVLAGRMMPRLGPRKLAVAGGIVLGIGYFLAGATGTKSPALLLVFIGLIGGAGIGLGYVVPIAVGMRWFPDKKGLITGLAVAGFGFGALIWVKLAGSWGNMIGAMGLSTTFMVYGIAFCAACLIGSIWMVFPAEGWRPKGWAPPEATDASGKPAAATAELTSGKMLTKPQFYMIFLCFVFGAGAGLMSIGLMKAFPMKAMMAGGLDWQAASAAAGTAMAVFFSLANGIGRIAWGSICERLGVKVAIAVMMVTQGVLMICFQWMAGTPGLLFIGAALIGFNFGGNFALFPMITAETFGPKHIGQNYGWVFLAYGVGGILGPIMGAKLGALDNFPLAFVICGVLCIIAGGLAALVRAPQPTAVTEADQAA